MTEQAFRLGTLESVLKTRLSAKLPELREAFPVEVKIGHSKDLAEDVEAGKFDAVFAIGAPEKIPGVLKAKAFAEDVMVIYPNGHAAVKAPADLKDLPLAALAAGCSYRKRAIDWLASAGEKPLAVNDQPNYAAIMDAVAEGKGFAAVPASVLSRSPRKAEIEARGLEGEEGKVWVEFLWREDAPAEAVDRIRQALGF